MVSLIYKWVGFTDRVQIRLIQNLVKKNIDHQNLSFNINKYLLTS